MKIPEKITVPLNLVLGTIFLIFSFWVFNTLNHGNSYTERALFKEQYLADSNECENCLHIQVEDFIHNEKRTYYFSQEHELLDINPWERVCITWRFIPKIASYRIRGVSRC